MPIQIRLVVDDKVPYEFFEDIDAAIFKVREHMLLEEHRPVTVDPLIVSFSDEDDEILNSHIRNLGLHSRTIGALSWAHRRGFAKSEIVTVGDLLGYSADDLLAMPQFGYVSLHNVRAALAKHGLHLMLEEVYEQGEG